LGEFPIADLARLGLDYHRVAQDMQIRKFCECEPMADVPHGDRVGEFSRRGDEVICTS
jgi:hypothetical protein